jgi:hypothetical protein
MHAQPGIAAQQAVDYRRALQAPFEHPQWAMTLLWETIAMMVPLVGPIVAFGYQTTMVEAIAREGLGATMPPFVLERLGDYLVRGIRLFVVSLLVSLVVTPIGLVVMFTANLLGAVLASREGALTFLGILLVFAGVAIFFLVLALAMVLVTPLWVKAALESDLGRVFDLAFARDFMRRTGKVTLLAHLVLMVLNIGLMFVGFLACFIGMFPALGIAVLVLAHVFGQLYLIYLGRGGDPIALPAAPPAPPWASSLPPPARPGLS